MILIDKLSYTSRLRYHNECVKLIFTILAILACVISRSMLAAIVTLLMTAILTVAIGRIPLCYYIKLMLMPLAFLCLSTIAIIVNISAVPLSDFSIPFFSGYITISADSSMFALQLIITALASVSCLYFLSLNTPMTYILNALRTFHCPSLIIELMLLIYRFIFILLNISHTLHLSQISRLGNKDFRTSCKCTGQLMAILFVRAFKKSSILYDSMESRCYNGSIHVLSESHPVKRSDLVLLILYLISMIGIIKWGLL